MDGEIYGHRPACNGSMVVMTYRGKGREGLNKKHKKCYFFYSSSHSNLLGVLEALVSPKSG